MGISIEATTKETLLRHIRTGCGLGEAMQAAGVSRAAFDGWPDDVRLSILDEEATARERAADRLLSGNLP